MNYGRQQASKKHEKITSKKTMKKKRMGVRFFKAFLLMCLIAIMLGVIGVGALFKKIIDDIIKEMNLAFEKFKEVVVRQNGDVSYIENLEKFEKAPIITPVICETDGFVEKLDAELAKMAEMYQMEVDKLKEYMGESEKEQMKADMAVQEAVTLLVDSAVEE